MDYEIFNVFKNYTLEVFVMAIGAFLLTYIIKLPIKKATNNLDENKRKAVNIVIMFIPLILSIIASVLFYGITNHEWISLTVLDSAISSWLLSLSIYAIVSRICIVIKGVWSGKIEINADLSTKTVKFLKSNLKEISKQLKIDEKELNQVVGKLEQVLNLKEDLTKNLSNVDLQKLTTLNSEIKLLEEKEIQLKQNINQKKQTINSYNEQLYPNIKTNLEQGE